MARFRSSPVGFSDTECYVALFVFLGFSNTSIATILKLRCDNVRQIRYRIRTKLKAHDSDDCKSLLKYFWCHLSLQFDVVVTLVTQISLQTFVIILYIENYKQVCHAFLFGFVRLKVVTLYKTKSQYQMLRKSINKKNLAIAVECIIQLQLCFCRREWRSENKTGQLKSCYRWKRSINSQISLARKDKCILRRQLDSHCVDGRSYGRCNDRRRHVGRMLFQRPGCSCSRLPLPCCARAGLIAHNYRHRRLESLWRSTNALI